MRVVSVNISGTLRTIEFDGRGFTTGIFKEPVSGPIAVTPTGLAGDSIGSPNVHGGPDQVVYSYAIEHYTRWQKFLDVPELPWGSLGENLTLYDIKDDSLHIGDVFRIGTALLEVSAPRVPCSTLAARHQRSDLPEAFQRYGKPGAYWRLREEGLVQAGAAIDVVERHPARFPLTEFYALIYDDSASKERLEHAAAVDAVPESWRTRFAERAAKL